LILGYSEKRAKRDKEIREELLKKIDKKKSSTIKTTVLKSRYMRYLNLDGELKIEPKKIEEDAKWDGYFGYYTNNKELKGEEVIGAYKLLWQVEDSFRNLKSTIKLRLIYHWTSKRIKGHIMMCFISFYILKVIEKELRNKGNMESFREVIEELKEIRTVELKLKKEKLIARTEIRGKKLEILRKLGVKIPKTI